MDRSTDNSPPSRRQPTTNAGNPIADDQNSFSAGPRSTLLQHDQLTEKLGQRNRCHSGLQMRR